MVIHTTSKVSTLSVKLLYCVHVQDHGMIVPIAGVEPVPFIQSDSAIDMMKNLPNLIMSHLWDPRAYCCDQNTAPDLNTYKVLSGHHQHLQSSMVEQFVSMLRE